MGIQPVDGARTGVTQSVKILKRSRRSENMRGLVLMILVAAVGSLAEAEEKAPETPEAAGGKEEDADYLEGEEEGEAYAYAPEGEDDAEWPEEWGDPELD